MSDTEVAGETVQAGSVPGWVTGLASRHSGLEVTVERPDDLPLALYVRSFLIMRVFVGAIGIAVPVTLVFGDWWLGGDPVPQDSLSAYYYTGMREVFVGFLAAIAVFLITYKVTDRSWDNPLSLVAGLAVLVVVIFPTGRPEHVNDELTPLQERLGESLVQGIHFGGAATFIGSIAVISFLFGVREAGRKDPQGTFSPRVWKWFHWGCGLVIVLAVLWIVVSKWTDLLPWEPRYWLLIGEWVAVWAFAFSWLAKGLELDTLRKGPPLSRILHAILAVLTVGIWLIIWWKAGRTGRSRPLPSSEPEPE